MKFKTLRTSITGQKLALIEAELRTCKEAQLALSKELGFATWYADRFAAAGGIEAVLFKDGADIPKHWISRDSAYYPDKRYKEGKRIQALFDNLPTVSRHELNSCIGYDSVWNQLGFSYGNPTYFGFFLDEKWAVVVPDDCDEILTSEWKGLFGKKELRRPIQN